MDCSLLTEVIGHICAQYDTNAERPWARAPAYIVFRHKDNKRIFAIAATVPPSKLGINNEKLVDIITLKVGDPLLKELLLQQAGIFQGLGFGQRDWVTILLNGTIPIEDIQSFIERSFRITASAKQKKQALKGSQMIRQFSRQGEEK